MQQTPLTRLYVDGREFLIKRDDLYDPYLSGNKFRKLQFLLDTPKEKYTTIISYGGTQSNAMLAIAALCKQKNWVFHYYTKPLSKTQKLHQQGNFAKALSFGMQHFEVEESYYKEFIASSRVVLDEKSLVIDQGGASIGAEVGLKKLAQEIEMIDEPFDAIATPSGTGTTALYLAKVLPHYTIYTTPSVGDSTYLRTQMQSLSAIPQNLTILESEKKYHFAKPYKEFYEVYEKLLEAGVEFDLLYAPLLWKMLLEQTEQKILYVHSGGVSGNISMQERYRRKGFAT